MSDVQRVIKYVAIAFAIYLIVNIISVIVFGISSMFFLFDGSDYIMDEMKETLLEEETVNIIDINISGTSLEIIDSDCFKVETNNEYVLVSQSNDKVTIKEKKHTWFGNNGNSKLIIYMPVEMTLEKFSIEAGAGKVSIDSIKTYDLDFDLGAGQVTISHLEVTHKASIEGGAGEFIIKSGILNHLDFDMGVGRAEITAEVLGNNEIKAGVGKLEINLLGKKDDYKIKVDKGLGSIIVDGDSLKSTSTYGNGTNKIDIEGGVGSIKVMFANSSSSDNSEERLLNDRTEFIRTYKVLSCVSEDVDTYYLTLQIYQGEVDTVLVRDFKEMVEQGKTYEFTFLNDSSVKMDEDTIKEIFKNYKLVSVKETDKIEMDQVQESNE